MWSIASVLLINLLYYLVAAVLCLGTMYAAVRIMDTLVDLDTEDQLNQGNIAVAIYYAGMFMGVGLTMGEVLSRAIS